MKIKSFLSGLCDGFSGALKRLDQQVEEKLGTDIQIYSVTDTFYKRKDASRDDSSNEIDDHIARVIVYDTLDKKVEN